jgi:hypothetical protein
MPLTLGTLAFALAVVSLVAAFVRRGDPRQKARSFVISGALILGSLHWVVTLSTITQNVLAIGLILALTVLMFLRPFRARPE